MAESWLHYTPSQGTGSRTIIYSTDFFYGRKSRNTTSSITSTSGTPSTSKYVTCNQYGYGLYSYANNINTAGFQTIAVDCVKTQMSASFTLHTNAKRIDISQIDTGTYKLPLTFSQTQSWTGSISGSGTWTSGNDVVGDPGAVQRYTTNINCSFTQNTGASRSGKIRVRVWYVNGESDVNNRTPTDNYEEYYLVVNQAGLIEYSVTIESLLPEDPSTGDNTRWTLSFAQTDDVPDTLIDGSLSVERSDGQFDICTVNGVIDSGNEYKLSLMQNGDYYTKNPDIITGNISNTSFSGVSQTDGYLCTGVE